MITRTVKQTALASVNCHREVRIALFGIGLCRLQEDFATKKLWVLGLLVYRAERL
jgi:hypothetical protein